MASTTTRMTKCLKDGAVLEIGEALRQRSKAKKVSFHCIRCEQPVHAHSGGSDGVEHFEHATRNPNCYPTT